MWVPNSQPKDDTGCLRPLHGCHKAGCVHLAACGLLQGWALWVGQWTSLEATTLLFGVQAGMD